MRQIEESGCFNRSDHLQPDAQDSIRCHRAVGDDPGISRFALHIFRDQDKMILLHADFDELGDVYVIEFLGGFCAFFELLAFRAIDDRHRNQLQSNGFIRAHIDRLVLNCRAGATSFLGRAVRTCANPEMLKENRAFHNPELLGAIIGRASLFKQSRPT